MSTYLVIDVSNLAHRAFHTTGGLSYGDQSTGVLFGLFRDIVTLKELFGVDRFAFCFDSRTHKRHEIFSEYKNNRRRELTEEEAERYSELYEQLRQFRTDHLPYIGFENVFHEEGYEADDLMASICCNLRSEDKAIIISSDQDLFQLLKHNSVSIWNPIQKKAISETSFRKMYDIDACNWNEVKAIAGCSGDGVPGVPGVGEKTAIKYLNMMLKTDSKKFEAILRSEEMIVRNMKLVTLPFDGTPILELNESSIDIGAWNEIMEELGVEILHNMEMSRPRRRR